MKPDENFCDFVWVMRKDYKIELAYYRNGNFFSPQACGDYEGLHTDEYDDVLAWCYLTEPDPERMTAVA
jgi:hypothetical protein